MRRVSAAETVRRFSALADEALAQPFVVTRNGRDRLVVISAEHFRHLISRAATSATEENKPHALDSFLKEYMEKRF